MKAFLRYFRARLRRESEEYAYRFYMADCAAGVIKACGNANVPRLYDLLHSAPEDNRAPQEIVQDITARAGLKVVKKHECIGPDGDAGA